MSTTNEIWLPYAGQLVRLDLDEDTALLPSFQANDRTKPETIQSDYSPEFSAPGTNHNHRLLGQAAASQPTTGQAYARLPCVLTSGGVETLPLGLLYLKGFKEGRYQLQLFGGNRRFIEQLGDKTLADLNLGRFDHYWTPANIAAGLTYEHWASQGWGYELFERGKPLNLEQLDPYSLYPSVAAQTVWGQIVADAGFTADSLLAEPMFAKANVPTANPFVYPQKFREARALLSGLVIRSISSGQGNPLEKTNEFPPDKLDFRFTALAPYHAPTQGASYSNGFYTVDTLGYYNLRGSILLNYGCDKNRPGKVSCKVMLYINGQPVFDNNDNQVGQDEHPRVGSYVEENFAAGLDHYLLHPGDTVSLWWQGDEWPNNGFGPYEQKWRVADTGGRTADVGLGGNLLLYTQATLAVELQEEFPQGGLVKLPQWLPDMKQLEFVKTYLLLGGLTIQTDAYRPHLRLAPGYKLLENIPKARDWTNKRDAYTQPGRLPERDLAFRFGEYAQRNWLRWAEDEQVTPGYGDGKILVADEQLPTEADMATLPFAASEASPLVAGLLRILNFKVDSVAVSPVTYSSVEAKPRLVLRQAQPALTGQIIMVPQVGQPGESNYVPQVKAPFTSTPSTFAGIDGLQLDGPVLTRYWSDLRAMLDRSRYLVEYYRLTQHDITTLDYSIPIWDGMLGDYFAVSAVGEYDARRPVEVRLCRLNAAHLPAPAVPGESGQEFYSQEFYAAEYY